MKGEIRFYTHALRQLDGPDWSSAHDVASRAYFTQPDTNSSASKIREGLKHNAASQLAKRLHEILANFSLSTDNPRIRLHELANVALAILLRLVVPNTLNKIASNVGSLEDQVGERYQYFSAGTFWQCGSSTTDERMHDHLERRSVWQQKNAFQLMLQPIDCRASKAIS